MAFVKVTPFYEEGNPMPKMLRFNELIHRKQKEEHSGVTSLGSNKEDKILFSTIKEEEGL